MCPWCPQLSKALSVWSTRFHVLTANSSTCLTKSVISKKKWVGSQVVCEKNTVSGELILFSPHLCWTVGSVYSLTVRSIYVVEHCSMQLMQQLIILISGMSVSSFVIHLFNV